MNNAPRLNEIGDFLLYDGECPVCARYVVWGNLQKISPALKLLNAHDEPELVAQLRSMGIESNDSFSLHLDGKLRHGAEAMAMLNRLAEPPNPIVRMLLGMLTKDAVAKPIYPFLVGCRKLLLKILGRKLIP
jgi:predicted DCC family thiol-disulfide oxidoreductase YuxK